MTQNAILLVGSAYGTYIPNVFLMLYSHEVEYLAALRKASDRYTDLKVPTGDYYWQTWQEVLDNFELTEDGTTWVLYHDQDLWLVPRHELEQFEEL